MKTNNIASYSDVLVTCMRQNPKWILLSEVRSAEAVTAVRNSISSGHNILSTIHADKAQSIPYRLYSLLESNIDVNQFMTTIYRYVQLGIHVRARYDKENGGFMREVCEVCEFHVTRDNVPEYNTIYRKNVDGTEVMNNPSEYLIDYLEAQGVMIKDKNYISETTEKPAENTIDSLDNGSNVQNQSATPTQNVENNVGSTPTNNVENSNNTINNNSPVTPSNNSESMSVNSSNVSSSNELNAQNNVSSVNVSASNVSGNVDLEKTQFFDVFSTNSN